MLRYFECSGRSTRRQYWIFLLVTTLLSLLALCGDYVLYDIEPHPHYPGPLTAFIGITHLIPSITVTVRRLHDTGRTGWFYCVQLAPVLGTLVLIYLMLDAPESGTNSYGPDPREGKPEANVGSSIPRQVRMGGAVPARPSQIAPGGGVQRFI
ncbi:DUF805 domain-containing protein [Devosia chinhatensis]|uniref:DUF805 domain-containing protein n=1 Tax=Devosia chinhatensis TaxID=429727 RepID=UPI0006972CFB|nr:DUF805 domain-containing protein [Devosia chinhatensis]